MDNFGHFACFSILSFKMRLRLTRNGQFHPIQNFSHLLPPKYVIFWEISKIFILGSGGGVTLTNFLCFSTFSNHFILMQLKMTHNGKFCQEKWLRSAQNGQFWLNFDKNLNISAESWPNLTIPSEQGLFFQAGWNESKECYAMIKTEENLIYLSGILTNLHWTFSTELVFPSQSKWVQGVVCYDQNWWKLKYLSGISIDLHWQFYLNFSTFLNCFRPKWLKMTHNGEFCQKSGLDWLKMANFGHFACFSIFPPKMRLRLTQNGQFHPIQNFSHLLPPKCVIFWEISKIFILGGRQLHWQIFCVFQLFQIISYWSSSKWPTMANFATEVAQISLKWAILG